MSATTWTWSSITTQSSRLKAHLYTSQAITCLYMQARSALMLSTRPFSHMLTKPAGRGLLALSRLDTFIAPAAFLGRPLIDCTAWHDWFPMTALVRAADEEPDFDDLDPEQEAALRQRLALQQGFGPFGDLDDDEDDEDDSDFDLDSDELDEDDEYGSDSEQGVPQVVIEDITDQGLPQVCDKPWHKNFVQVVAGYT